MTAPEAWIGTCHFVTPEESSEYHCLTAVWCNNAESFRSLLTEEATRLDRQVLWVEDALPATRHLARHGQAHDIGPLARAVHPLHIVEFGPLIPCGTEKTTDDYLTKQEHVFFPLKAPSSLPSWDHRWIAPDLEKILFGQDEDRPKMRTYCILDAELRKKITGFFDLDEGIPDVPLQCLFNGEAAEELRESAPYIIDMTLPDGAQDTPSRVPSFHKDFFARHWAHNTGIFIRTEDSLEQVRQHFRKFTRVQMEEDKRWVYFRFYDPRILPAFIDSLDENDLHKFIGTYHVLCPSIEDPTCLNAYSATNPMGHNQRQSLPAFIMKQRYLEALSTNREQSFSLRLKQYLENNIAAFNELGPEEQPKRLEYLIKQAKDNGFRVELAVANFVSASLLSGQDLMQNTHFAQIMTSSKNQIDKSRLILSLCQNPVAQVTGFCMRRARPSWVGN